MCIRLPHLTFACCFWSLPFAGLRWPQVPFHLCMWVIGNIGFCCPQMMDRLGETAKLEPPEDGTITTMYIGGLTPAMSEDDIREPFLPFGEVRRKP